MAYFIIIVVDSLEPKCQYQIFDHRVKHLANFVHTTGKNYRTLSSLAPECSVAPL